MRHMNKKSKSKNLMFMLIVISVVVFGLVGWNMMRKNTDSIVNRVTQLPEVQEFKQAVEENGRSTFMVRIDRMPTDQEPFYSVQVYEIFPDHQTTFNWYRVDKVTNNVSKLDIVTDTWEQVEQ